MKNVYNTLMSKNVSFKENTLWYTLGTMCNSASNVLLMVYVTHILGVDEAGVFSISYSIAQLMLTIGWFGTRQFQVSDIYGIFRFHDYFYLKIITAMMSILGGIVYGLMLHLSAYKFFIMILYCVFNICDTFADLFSAKFQQEDKLFIGGMSYLIRIVGYNIIFLLTLFAFKKLYISLICSFIYSISELILFDWQMLKRYFKEKYEFKWKKIVLLSKSCFPLFVSSFVSILIVNIPKNAIEQFLNNSMQTYYNIIFMPSALVNLFCMFVFVPMYTEIARKWRDENLKSFKKEVSKLLGISVIFSVIILLISFLLGIPFLEILYGVNLKSYKFPFMILMCAGCLMSVNSILSYIITVMRKQKYILCIYAISVIASQILVNKFVCNYQILGASYIYFIGMVMISLLSFMIYLNLVKHKN